LYATPAIRPLFDTTSGFGNGYLNPLVDEFVQNRHSGHDSVMSAGEGLPQQVLSRGRHPVRH
jgi:hypothetical protein